MFESERPNNHIQPTATLPLRSRVSRGSCGTLYGIEDHFYDMNDHFRDW